MFYECCVCKNSRQDATLHHFPRSEKRLHKWLKCLNRASYEFTKSSPEQLSKMFICQKHFEKKFITPKSRLIVSAYPSLFTQDEISSGMASEDNTEDVDPEEDHNYVSRGHSDHTYYKNESEKADTATMEAVPSTSGANRESISVCQIASNEHSQVSIAETHVTVEPLPSTSEGQKQQQEESSRKRKVNVPNQSATCNAVEGPSQATGTGLDETQSVKKPKAPRKRLVTKLKDLTPQSRKIYEEFKKSKRQVDFYQRAKRALKFNKTKAFKKLTYGLNPYAKRILKMQINLCTKRKEGRRFTTEEKTIALAIMKQSPKCYRFLQKNFILPSRSTLNKMVEKLKMGTGICPQVFELLKKEINGWDEKKKMCSLLFDEISLERGLTYDKNRNTINGLVELQEKKTQYADHALVFMLRGAVYKWQQPIAFYFCEGATNAIELKNILKEVVTAVVGCGLKPIALICDQGSSFRSAIQSLKEDTKREQILTNQESDDTITVSGAVSLRVIFDPPHLIKGLRNNFLNKDIKHDGKISKWSDIVQVYENDNDPMEPRLLHKLNDQHVIPGKIKKMKVKNCVKVFTTTMAAALRYSARYPINMDGTPACSTMKNTAEIVKFFDQLFDSVNGTTTYPTKKGKTLRTAVTDKSPHHEFWRTSEKKLKEMKFIGVNGEEKYVPSLRNFLTTLKSFRSLWQLFKSLSLK